MTDQTLKDIDRAFKALEERDELLDKIRAEIEEINPYDLPSCDRTAEKMISRVLDIIDKYKGEQP